MGIIPVGRTYIITPTHKSNSSNSYTTRDVDSTQLYKEILQKQDHLRRLEQSSDTIFYIGAFISITIVLSLLLLYKITR